MYNQLKKILFRVLPKKIIFKYEFLFRKFQYLLYIGNNFKCNVCNKNLRDFIIFPDGDKVCPYCGSNARNRRLWKILNDGFLKSNISILHFSPSRNLYRVLKSQHELQYISTDLSGDFISDKSYNITNISVNDNTFDLIICYHILEHIEEDQTAMKELFRILKPDGRAIVQTPFQDGDIFEDTDADTPEKRLKAYGQKDHVRIYSVNGLVNRLEKSGFKVDVNEFFEKQDNLFGLYETETVLILKK